MTRCKHCNQRTWRPEEVCCVKVQEARDLAYLRSPNTVPKILNRLWMYGQAPK